MSTGNLTKPKNLLPDEEWAWENSEPGSWQRRALARAAALRTQAEEDPAERDEEAARKMQAAAHEKAVALSRDSAGGARPEWAYVQREILTPYLKAHNLTRRGKADKARREERRRRLSAEAARVFIRFGNGPPDGISRNHYDDAPEGGLSVFPAYELLDGRYVVDPEEDADLVISLLLLWCWRRSSVYLAHGREVGRGSGGEPLLADFTLEKLSRDAVESLWDFPFAWRAGAVLGPLCGMAR